MSVDRQTFIKTISPYLAILFLSPADPNDIIRLLCTTNEICIRLATIPSEAEPAIQQGTLLMEEIKKATTPIVHTDLIAQLRQQQSIVRDPLNEMELLTECLHWIPVKEMECRIYTALKDLESTGNEESFERSVKMVIKMAVRWKDFYGARLKPQEIKVDPIGELMITFPWFEDFVRMFKPGVLGEKKVGRFNIRKAFSGLAKAMGRLFVRNQENDVMADNDPVDAEERAIWWGMDI